MKKMKWLAWIAVVVLPAPLAGAASEFSIEQDTSLSGTLTYYSAWSPDSMFICVLNFQNNVVKIDTLTQSATQILGPSSAIPGLWQIAVIPDQNYVLFGSTNTSVSTGVGDTQQTIARGRLDGVDQASFDFITPSLFGFSDVDHDVREPYVRTLLDGTNWLVCNVLRWDGPGMPVERGVFLVQIQEDGTPIDGTVKQIFGDARLVHKPVLSPDGDKLLFIVPWEVMPNGTINWDIYLVAGVSSLVSGDYVDNINDPRIHKLDTSTNPLFFAQFSADGRWIFFSEDLNGVFTFEGFSFGTSFSETNFKVMAVGTQQVLNDVSSPQVANPSTATNQQGLASPDPNSTLFSYSQNGGSFIGTTAMSDTVSLVDGVPVAEFNWLGPGATFTLLDGTVVTGLGIKAKGTSELKVTGRSPVTPTELIEQINLDLGGVPVLWEFDAAVDSVETTVTFDPVATVGLFYPPKRVEGLDEETLDVVVLTTSASKGKSDEVLDRQVALDVSKRLIHPDKAAKATTVIARSPETNEIFFTTPSIGSSGAKGEKGVTGQRTVFAVVGTSLDPNTDSDGDGLLNGVETNTGVYVSPSNTGTDPLNPDSDGDDLSDGDEVNQYGTDPNNWDTDFDGVSDGDEVKWGFDPLDPNNTPNIDALSGWGLIILALAMLLGGMAMLSSRRYTAKS